MKMSKEKRALIAGMIGCLLYVIGDFLFAATGKSQSTESIGLMVKVAYLDMATWRMVVSIICGVLGTALYYIGFHQMWKLLKQHLTQPKQQKWVKLFQIAYLTGTVCWGYVHAMFMNVALIFKFTFEKYGDMQAAAEIANKVFYCNAAPLLAAYILCDVLLSVVMSAGQGAEFEICNPGLGVWVNDVNIIWNEKEAGQWGMRPNALLLVYSE